MAQWKNPIISHPYQSINVRTCSSKDKMGRATRTAHTVKKQEKENPSRRRGLSINGLSSGCKQLSSLWRQVLLQQEPRKMDPLERTSSTSEERGTFNEKVARAYRSAVNPVAHQCCRAFKVKYIYQYCNRLNQIFLPTSSDCIIGFVANCVGKGIAYATFKIYLATVADRHAPILRPNHFSVACRSTEKIWATHGQKER